MKTIAILGAGAMGSRMAERLLKAGHPVVVYNRSADRVNSLVAQGATYAPTPKAAAERANVVISMVTDDEASRAVWLTPETGAAAGLASGAIAIESSTLTVGWTQELAAQMAQRNVAFLDAPVVGSRPQAEAGKLIYLVGGDAATLDAVRDILMAIGGALHHVGPSGQGMAMKLAVNALFGIQVAALAEAIGALTRQGLGREQAIACLRALPIMSPAASGAGQLMMAGSHAPLFPIELVEKDFRYALEAGAVQPLAAAARDIYQRAIAEGYGGDNITGVLQVFEDGRT
ncbi:MAG: NAD(P)-dependent oxidoreductase [Elainellaceae cyanobacterium]